VKERGNETIFPTRKVTLKGSGIIFRGNPVKQFTTIQILKGKTAMARKKPTWREKLHDSKGHPTVSSVTEKMSKRWGSGTMVIPAPLEVDEIMKKVRKGRVITIDVIRQILAKKHNADFTCPITTGIFAWIAANAADEAEREGKKRITPCWRTLKSGGELNPKYPGGLDNLKARLESEGLTIVQKRKRLLVEYFENHLVKV